MLEQILRIADEFLVIWALIFTVLIFSALFLHVVVFPKKIKNYPRYCVDSTEVNGEMKTDTVMGKVTLRKVIHRVIVFVLLLILACVLEKVWPMGSIPKELPRTFVRQSDERRLWGGDFGTMTILQYGLRDDPSILICERVDAYGPFEYAGEYEELVISQYDWSTVRTVSPYNKYYDQFKSEYLYVSFANYEDGTWMIVKTFVWLEDQPQDDYHVSLDGEDALLVLSRAVETGKIKYRTHDFTNRNDVSDALSNAVNGLLLWERTDDGLIWTAKE